MVRPNCAKNAVSRYIKLKKKFDERSLFSNWFEVDTQNVSSKPSQITFIDLFSGAGGMCGRKHDKVQILIFALHTLIDKPTFRKQIQID